MSSYNVLMKIVQSCWTAENSRATYGRVHVVGYVFSAAVTFELVQFLIPFSFRYRQSFLKHIKVLRFSFNAVGPTVP